MKNFLSFALFIVMILVFTVSSCAKERRVSVKADGKTLTAIVEDNPASRELYAKTAIVIEDGRFV